MKINENKIDKTIVKLNSKNTLIPAETMIDDMLYIGRVIDKDKERYIFKCTFCNSIKIVSKHTIIQREHLYRPFYHSLFGDVPRTECQIKKPNQLTSLSREFLIEEESEPEMRTLKVLFNHASGNASKNSYSPKLSLPMKFLKDMGISPDERTIVATFDGEKIVIQKKM